MYGLHTSTGVHVLPHLQVLQDCLRLSLVDYKGVNVKLLKLTGEQSS